MNLKLVGTVVTQNEIKEIEFITKIFVVSIRYLYLGRLARKQVINAKYGKKLKEYKNENQEVTL